MEFTTLVIVALLIVIGVLVYFLYKTVVKNMALLDYKATITHRIEKCAKTARSIYYSDSATGTTGKLFNHLTDVFDSLNTETEGETIHMTRFTECALLKPSIMLNKTESLHEVRLMSNTDISVNGHCIERDVPTYFTLQAEDVTKPRKTPLAVPIDKQDAPDDNIA